LQKDGSLGPRRDDAGYNQSRLHTSTGSVELLTAFSRVFSVEILGIVLAGKARQRYWDLDLEVRDSHHKAGEEEIQMH